MFSTLVLGTANTCPILIPSIFTSKKIGCSSLGVKNGSRGVEDEAFPFAKTFSSLRIYSCVCVFICVVFACLVTAVGGSLQTTESALAAVAISLGAEEDCVQRWKNAVSEATPGAGDDEPLAVSRRGKGLVRSGAKLTFSEKPVLSFCEFELVLLYRGKKIL